MYRKGYNVDIGFKEVHCFVTVITVFANNVIGEKIDRFREDRGGIIMRRTKWFRKVVTAIVALAVVCQMSLSSSVVYAAWDDVSAWENEADEWDTDEWDNDGWEDADDEVDDDDVEDWDDSEEDTEDEDTEDDDTDEDDAEDWDDETDDEDTEEDDDEFEEPVLSSSSLTLKAGSVAGLKVTGSYEYIEWSSSKPSVAKVDSSGAVKAVKAGTTVIKAKVTCFIETEDDYYEDEDFFDEEDSDDEEELEGEEVTYTLKCTVKVKAANIKISAKKLTIKKGKSAKLKITGTSAKVTWKSSNKKVATVNKGTVKAKKAGKTTITAKVSGKTLKCSVTVKKK